MSTVAAQPTAAEAQSSASRSFRRSGVVVAAVVAGGAMGFALGSRTGVGEPIHAAGRQDARSAEALDGSQKLREIARLLEEARTARALIESLRHDEEGIRAGARLRALEAARDQGAARLERLEQRLDRLEARQIDPIPTGSLPKSESRRDAR